MKKTVIATILVLGLVAAAGYASAQTDPSATQDPAATAPASALDASASSGLDVQQLSDQINSYDTGVTPNDINTTVTPENPTAFQDVGISVDSDLVDLRRYMITWYVNGAVVQQGIGKQTLSTKTRDYGEPVSIRIEVQVTGITVTKDITLIPEDISMMWEAADSYAPPFYEGKKLPSREGIVKIVAIPNFLENGQTVDPSGLVYNWKRNYNILTQASTYGQQSILVKNNKLRTAETFEVTASTPDSQDQADASMTLSFFDPKILFYEKSVDTGLLSPYSKSRMVLTDPSTTVVAQPYFFSLTGPNKISSLTTSWKMNDTPITLPDPLNQNIITLKNPGGSGIANLSLSITNPNTDFQSAINQLSVIFNKK